MRLALPLLLFVVATSAKGQMIDIGRRAVTADSVPATIAMAEAMGAHYPRSRGPDSTQVTLRGTRGAGTVDHKCVEVGATPSIRSGDFTVFGFARYSDVWHSGMGKLNWMPDHPSLESPVKLVVRAARLDENAPRWIFVREGGMTHAVASLSDFSYPSGFRLPSTGKWMLVASAGTNWGCFVFHLT